MLNVNAVGAKSKLRAAVSATATMLPLTAGDAANFAMGAGNYLYVTLRGIGGMIERVRVTAVVGNDLTVSARGVDGTNPQVWSAGACVEVEWSPAMVCEYMINCASGAPAPTGVVPQTICLNTCACIDVAANGTITAINKGTGCL